MKRKRSEMDGNLIKKAVQNYEQGKSNRASARELGVDHTTISRWLSAVKAKKLTWQLIKQLSDEEVSMLVKRSKGPGSRDQHPIDFTLFCDQLANKKGFTLEDCWHEYQKSASNAGHPVFSRSSFYTKLSAHIKDLAPITDKIKMAQTWLPGDYLAIDYAGDPIEIKTDNGKQKLKVFVAILPCSRMIYAKVLPDGTTESWVKGIVGALEYFGGCPRYILADNDVALVKNTERGNKVCTKAFRDLLAYYGMEPSFARVRSPRDKGICEGAVRIVERAFIHRLEPGTVKCIEDAELLCTKTVDQINDAIRADTGMSRRSVFESTEQALLQPLRLPTFSCGAIYRTYKVRSNGLIAVDGHYYSVNWQFIGKEVLVVCKPERILEIYAGRQSKLLSQFRWFEQGKADPVETFYHIRPEDRHPGQLDEEQRLNQAIERLRAKGEFVSDFVERLRKKQRRMPKGMLADELNRLHRKTSPSEDSLLNGACQQAIEIGKIDIDLVLSYVETMPRLSAKKANEENLAGYLRAIDEYKEMKATGKRSMQ